MDEIDRDFERQELAMAQKLEHIEDLSLDIESKPKNKQKKPAVTGKPRAGKGK